MGEGGRPAGDLNDFESTHAHETGGLAYFPHQRFHKPQLLIQLSFLSVKQKQMSLVNHNLCSGEGGDSI